MVNRIIKDIESSINNKAYFAALALALTLPDICGKAEYPDADVGIRYKKWFDDNIGKYEKPPDIYDDKGLSSSLNDDMPYMSGEIIYLLRNSFLHQGTPSIEKKRIREKRCKVTHFTLIIANATDGGSSSIYHNCFMDSERRTLEINIINLCCKICLTAKRYFEENKMKFNFFQYDLQDRTNGKTDLLWGLSISENESEG